MDELKKQLVEELESRLDYYDVVDENFCTVDYGVIIDALFKAVCKVVRQKLLGGE